MHIFIDESGAFQDHDPNGLIVFAAVTTNDAPALRRLVRRTRRAKLRTKREKRESEIKGSTATDKFKAYLYRLSARIQFEVYVIFLRMESIRMDDWTRKAGVLRLRLIKKLLEAAGADRTEPIEVIMDRQPLPGVTANGFIIAIEEAFGGTIAAPRLFHAHFKDSKEDPGIQIADFIAHDIARKYLHGDDRWFRLFQEKIRVELNGATHL